MKKPLMSRNQLVFMIFCLAINIICYSLATALQLPLWLDSIGTCLAAYFTGPLGAVFVCIAHHLFFAAAFSLSELPYLLISLFLTMCYYICARQGYLDHFNTAMVSAFAIMMLNILLTFPLNYLVAGGYSGNHWGEILYDMLIWNNEPKIVCCVLATAFIEVIDKPFCIAVAYALIKAVRKYQQTHSGAVKAGLFFSVLLLSAALPASASAADDVLPLSLDYATQIYNAQNGMPFSKATSITETADGYLWISSYSGLTRFDGRIFNRIDENGFTSVTQLMTDKQNRIWVGTTDSGVGIFEGTTLTALYNTDNGLANNQIYSLAEDRKGNVYVGTAKGLHRFSKNSIKKFYDSDEVIMDVLPVDDQILYLNYDGELNILSSSGKLMDKLILGDDSYTALADTPQGLFAGTTSGRIIHLVREGSSFAIKKIYKNNDLQQINDISMDSKGRIWLCAINGFGYMDKNKHIYVEEFEQFNHSIEAFHEDYQGNLWFVSSHYGVLKLSENPFTNLFLVAGITPASINSVTEFEGDYFCCTDSGLIVLDGDSHQQIDHELTAYTENSRIRCSMTDSQGNLWLCTYGEYGLIQYDPHKKTVNYYTPGHGDTENTAFRCVMEMSDGTIVAGTTTGINFIRDGKVTDTIVAEEELEGRLVLCLTEGKDGLLYACIDGAGIFALRDGRIEEHLTTQQGLSSNVVMRMVPYGDGFFLVSSNQLNYFDEDGIRILDSFPFYNNYDLLLDGENAYIMTEQGIVSTNAEKLKANQCKSYHLYDARNGLEGTPIANSWNFIDEEGTLYFCCSNGPTTLPLRQQVDVEEIKYGISEVYADSTLIPMENGIYRLPAEMKILEIVPSLRHYSLDNIKMRFYIKDISQTTRVFNQNTLTNLSVSNLSTGTHILHFQILSEDESQILSENTFRFVRQAHSWENKAFRFYMYFVVIWFIAFFVWVLTFIANIGRRKKDLEIMSHQLEEKVQEQTSEIRAQSEKMAAYQWSVVESMADLIESRDDNTGTHVIRTREYTELLASALEKRHLHEDLVDDEFVYLVSHVAPLHDVGKIKVSDLILNKPGRFTPEEFELMKRHSIYGKEVVESILGADADPKMLKMASDIAVYHHEKWDGTGYPYGLKGEEIPLSARIMAVADVFDALISKRVYKDAMGLSEAFHIIQEGSGKHFDPELVEIFFEEQESILKIAKGENYDPET